MVISAADVFAKGVGMCEETITSVEILVTGVGLVVSPVDIRFSDSTVVSVVRGNNLSVDSSFSLDGVVIISEEISAAEDVLVVAS